MANPVEVYTPLFSEILEKVAKAKTKAQKVQLLQKHNTAREGTPIMAENP